LFLQTSAVNLQSQNSGIWTIISSPSTPMKKALGGTFQALSFRLNETTLRIYRYAFKDSCDCLPWIPYFVLIPTFKERAVPRPISSDQIRKIKP
jgi:hypothetical protein